MVLLIGTSIQTSFIAEFISYKIVTTLSISVKKSLVWKLLVLEVSILSMVKLHLLWVLFGNCASFTLKKELVRSTMRSWFNGETAKYQLSIKSRTLRTSQSETVNSSSTLLKRSAQEQSTSAKSQLAIHKKNRSQKSITQLLLLVNLVVKLLLFGNTLTK